MLKIVYHEGCLTRYFTSAAEEPLRISAIHARLSKHYPTITPEPATKADVLRVHTAEHLGRVQQEGNETYQTALLAAGGAICAAGLGMEGSPAFAVVRPPGHHAARSRYGGFCFFNNLAIALGALMEAEEVRSAAIVDFDMHFGDGTKDIFGHLPSVSIIDFRLRERQAYLDRLLEEIGLLPSPLDVIAVSAGFDLYARDWGGLLATQDFQRIGFAIRQAAEEKASGHCFAVLEGGYFLNDLARNALAFCRGLEGQQPQ